jgi:hypothetical protein
MIGILNSTKAAENIHQINGPQFFKFTESFKKEEIK